MDLSQQDALASLQQYEAAEVEGLLYVNAAGQLCFDGRQVRMGAGAPSVTFPAGSYDPDMGFKQTDQYLLTQAAIDTPAVAKAVTAVNPQALADYGPYVDGSDDAPTELPVLGYSPIFATAQSTQGFAPQLDQVQDVANWTVNRGSDPRVRPKSVTIDLLTNTNPAASDYVAISTVYGIDVNGTFTLAGGINAMPNDAGALDYFAEGVVEYKDLVTHTVQFYTSPMNQKRCWVPGDATYGVLDSTAVIGVSATDDGHAIAPKSKLTSADPGAPFWPPTYSTSMNSGGLSGKGFVGAKDQRGIYGNLQTMMQPPICVLGQTSTVQVFATSGSTGIQTLNWDTVFMDSAVSFGLLPGFPNFYVVTVAGYWELEATIVWAAGGSSASGRFTEFLVNPQGSSEGPLGSHALNVGGTQRRANTAQVPGISLSTRMYLGVGTTVGLRAYQTSGGSLSQSISNGGSMMSVKFAGFQTVAG